MIKIETTLQLIYDHKGNKFTGGCTEILHLLNSKGGLMETLVDELTPDEYKITIKIKKVKP